MASNKNNKGQPKVPFEGVLHISDPLSEDEKRKAERDKREQEYRDRDDSYKSRQTTTNSLLVLFTLLLVISGGIGNYVSYRVAKAAELATEAASNSFRLTEQSNLTVIGTGFGLDQRGQPSLKMIFSNSGHIPARSTVFQGCIDIRSSEPNSILDSPQGRCIKRTYEDIAPGTPMTQNMYVPIANAINPRISPEDPGNHVYTWGVVRYNDKLSTVRFTQFCFVNSGIQLAPCKLMIHSE